MELNMYREHDESVKPIAQRDFIVGGWVLFYRDDMPLSIYRVTRIDDGRIQTSGGGWYDKNGIGLFDGELLFVSTTYIKPIDIDTAMLYIMKRRYYIRDDDRQILLAEATAQRVVVQQLSELPETTKEDMQYET